MVFSKVLFILSFLFITNAYALDGVGGERIKEIIAKDLADHKAKCTKTSPCVSYLIYFKYIGEYKKHSGCGIRLVKSDYEATCPSDINRDKFKNGRNIIDNITYYFNGDNVVYELSYNPSTHDKINK